MEYKLKSLASFEFTSMSNETLEAAKDVMVRSYFKDEGVSKGVQLLKSPEATKEILTLMSLIAEDGVSLVAIEKETKRVVAVWFNKIQVKPKNRNSFFEEYMEKCLHPSSKLWVDIMKNAATAVDLFATCNAPCLLEMVCGAVLPEYRRRGIANLMIENTIELVRSLVNFETVKKSMNGCELPILPIPEAVITVVTATGTQSICSAKNFCTALSINYSALVYNGLYFDKIVGGEPKSLKTMYLKV